MKLTNKFFLFLILSLFNNIAFSQDTLVYWNFVDSNATVDKYTLASNSSKTISVSGPDSSSYLVSGSTNKCAWATGKTSANGGWRNGDTVPKYWEINFSTIGYINIKVSSKQRSSPTGPRDFKVQYKVGLSGIYADLSGATSIRDSDSWTSPSTNKITDISLPSSCENGDSIYLRWVMRTDSCVNCSGDTVKYTGTSRIDDIKVTGVLDTPLPIGLIGFDAKYINSVVNINWSVGTEINNDHYEIQRSKDCKLFNTILNIPGYGNCDYTLNYKSVDKTPLDGISYYRLKPVDYDSMYEVFNPVAVNVDRNNNFNLYFLINGKLIELNVLYDEDIDITYHIYDNNGREISKDIFRTNTKLVIPVPFPPGIYFIKIVTPYGEIVRKFIL